MDEQETAGRRRALGCWKDDARGRLEARWLAKVADLGKDGNQMVDWGAWLCVGWDGMEWVTK